MEDFRSKSCGDGRMQIQTYNHGLAGGGGGGGGGAASVVPTSSSSPSSGAVNGMQDLRCYSASYASSVYPTTQTHFRNSNNNTNNNNSSNGNGNYTDVKFKKGKSTSGAVSKSWSFADPELQRKKRVASYKVYTVEGKVKGSFRKSFRWIKEKYSRAVYGWR